MKKSLISVATLSALAMLVASCASGPHMRSEVVAASMGQTTGVDMQGNVVELGAFTYGGDNQAGYANGMLATGAKDPSVCGSFAAAKCSVGHLK